MKTSKWNLATLQMESCNPTLPSVPSPCVPCLPCPALALGAALGPALGPGPGQPPFPFSSKSCKTVIFGFSGLENLKMESCNPALPFVPCPCALCPAPCLRPCPAPCPALCLKESCNPALPLPLPCPWPCPCSWVSLPPPFSSKVARL